MRRRYFLAMLAGSAAIWPLAAVAPAPAGPVIGFLDSRSPDQRLLASFHQGLSDLGYVEGRNLAIVFRSALGDYEKLQMLAADLAQRRVALIVTSGGSVTAKVTKQVTSTIPILFSSSLDPIREHLVESYNLPGGNATGMSHYNIELMSKRLELLVNLLPREMNAKTPEVALLRNDDYTGLEDQLPQRQALTEMARKLGLRTHNARSENDIEAEFKLMAQQKTDALLVAPDPLFVRQRALIVELAARYSLPVGYPDREFVRAGGLMSYGPDLSESWRQIGQYAGRILDGARPESLPVMLPRKYELVINRKTAKALGLGLKRTLADEIID